MASIIYQPKYVSVSIPVLVHRHLSPFTIQCAKLWLRGLRKSTPPSTSPIAGRGICHQRLWFCDVDGRASNMRALYFVLPMRRRCCRVLHREVIPLVLTSTQIHTSSTQIHTCRAVDVVGKPFIAAKCDLRYLDDGISSCQPSSPHALQIIRVLNIWMNEEYSVPPSRYGYRSLTRLSSSACLRLLHSLSDCPRVKFTDKIQGHSP